MDLKETLHVVLITVHRPPIGQTNTHVSSHFFLLLANKVIGDLVGQVEMSYGFPSSSEGATMIPVEAGEPLCSAFVEVAEGSGTLMDRHIKQFKQVSNGNLAIDWDELTLTGEFRHKEFHSDWGRTDFRVSYFPQPPAPNGLKITQIRVDVWGSGLGKRHSRSAHHDEARSVLLRFIFPKENKGAFMGVQLIPD